MLLTHNRSMTNSLRGRTWLPALFALTLFVTSCGGDEEVSGGVASISEVAGADAVNAADALQAAADETATLSPEEAGLALSACMRDGGYPDFPDATVDDQGRLNLQAALGASGIDLRDEQVRAQLATCQEAVGTNNFGTAGRGGDRGDIGESLLGYTQCLRDQGLDVGDIAIGQPGAGGAEDGAASPAGDGGRQGQPRGEGGARGDQSGRLAAQLGLDADDPTTAAALDACQGALDEAFAGIGAPGASAPATSDN